MRITRVMPSFEGVAAGQTATCRMPIGLSYHHLNVAYSGVTLAQMTDIRLVANGKVYQRYPGGDELDVFNQFDGRSAASGRLILPIGDRFGLRTREAQEFTAIGTGKKDDPRPITTLALEVDIDAGAAGPVLSMKANQSAPRESGLIKQVRHFNYTAGGAGDFEIADLPKGGIINRIFFKSGDINSLKVERDGYTVFERDATDNDVEQGDGVRVPQAGYFVYDPTEQGNGAEGLATKGVHDLRFTLDMAAGGSIPVTVEYLDVIRF